MKFCNKKVFTYSGINSIPTSTHYVTEEEISKVHGNVFLEQFKYFLDKKNIKSSKFGEDEGYYYYDYKELAYSVQQYLEIN